METITFNDGTKYTLSDTNFWAAKDDLDYLFAKFHAPFAKKHKIVNYTNHLYYWKFGNHFDFGKEWDYNKKLNPDLYNHLTEKYPDLKDNQLVKNWFFGILNIKPEEKLELFGKVHPLYVKLHNCTPDNFCKVTEDVFLQVLKKNYPEEIEKVFILDEIIGFAKGGNGNAIIEQLIKKGYNKIIEILKPKMTLKFLEKFYTEKSKDTHHILFRYLTPGQKEEFAPKIKPLNLKWISSEDFKYFKNRIDEFEIRQLITLESDMLLEVIKVIDCTLLSPFYLEKLKNKINIAELSEALYPWED